MKYPYYIQISNPGDLSLAVHCILNLPTSSFLQKTILVAVCRENSYDFSVRKSKLLIFVCAKNNVARSKQPLNLVKN